MTKQQLIIPRGLPTSGVKSWCDKWLNRDLNSRTVLSFDEMKCRMYGLSYPSDLSLTDVQEQELTVDWLDWAKSRLEIGKSVCLLHHNLSAGAVEGIVLWLEGNGLKNKENYELEVVDHFMNAPLMECLEANRHGEYSGYSDNYLIDLYQKHLKGIHYLPQNKYLPKAVVFDLDGTLVSRGDRYLYDATKIHLDYINPSFKTMYSLLWYNEGLAFDKIIYSTAREDTGVCRVNTEEWLGLFTKKEKKRLLMRSCKDYRPDWMVKESHAIQILKNYHIECWFDDNPNVCTHLRTLGINVLQLEYGQY